jgi:protein TonB
VIAQDNKVHRVGEPGLKPPRVISKFEPEYTPEATADKIQGTTVLQLTIDQNGKAQDIWVVKSLDEGLDQKAVDAVTRWQFQPAMKDGNPVLCAATIEINFRLE